MQKRIGISLLMLGLGTLGLSSCMPRSLQASVAQSREPNPSNARAMPTNPIEAPVEAPVETPVEALEVVTTPPVPTVSVTLYQVDSQCRMLVAETVDVPADDALNVAIGQVIAQQYNSDLQIAGYRVNVASDSGMATVDLRLAPDAQRRLRSLAPCEQLALFGSLRKTLLENEQWQVKDVQFTERGQALLF